jgi:hypothetical protein
VEEKGKEGVAKHVPGRVFAFGAVSGISLLRASMLSFKTKLN